MCHTREQQFTVEAETRERVNLQWSLVFALGWRASLALAEAASQRDEGPTESSLLGLHLRLASQLNSLLNISYCIAS